MAYIDKVSLRGEQLAKRKLISSADKAAWDKAIASRVIEYLEEFEIRAIHIFRSLRSLGEIDTQPIIDWALSRDIKVYSTLKIAGEWRIALLPLAEETEAPSGLDALVIPLLAFDRRLHRLGHGGGYYDRLCARFGRAHRLGLAYEFQKVEQLPDEPHDIALAAVITEKALYKAKAL